MPRGNKRGPLGRGPMTGRRLGYCVGHPYPGHMNPMNRGWGGGWGRGWGGGWGRNRWETSPYETNYPFQPPTTKEEKGILREEKEILTEDVSILRDEIKAIEKRLKEIEKKKK